MMTILFHGRRLIIKTCTKCKTEKPKSEFSKNVLCKDGLQSCCRACRSAGKKADAQRLRDSGLYDSLLERRRGLRVLRKSLNPREFWAETAVSRCRDRAKIVGIECDLTKEWFVKNAPERCPLLGVTLVYDSAELIDNCASVDRRNSTKGYTQDNCSIISFKANRIKNNANIYEIELLASNLREYL